MRSSLTIALLSLSCVMAAPLAGHAQNPARRPAGQGGGVLTLPQGVKRVVSIDAYNMLLVEVDRDGKPAYTTMPIKHVYSGGIASLFGGTTIPTAQFVSPAAAGGNGAGGTAQRAGRGQGFGVTGTGFGNNTGGFGGGGNAGGVGGLFGGFGGGLGAVSNFSMAQPSPATIGGQGASETGGVTLIPGSQSAVLPTWGSPRAPENASTLPSAAVTVPLSRATAQSSQPPAEPSGTLAAPPVQNATADEKGKSSQ